MTSEEFRSIENLFIENSNPSKIEQMTAYMKGKFKYLGISAPERKLIMKKIFHAYKWERSEILSFAELCWKSKFRELQYAGLDILNKHGKKLGLENIDFLEELVITNSWWDTVDGLAVNPIGTILAEEKESQIKYTRKWAHSENLWLRRVAIIYQLKYKTKVDLDLMEYAISKASGTKEFFLNKAIGWMLREYSKTNPEYVIDFCEKNELSTLSRREALRLTK